MRLGVLFILTIGFLGPARLWSQTLEVGLDWSMGAVVSASDATNGATDGAPSLALAFDFQGIAAEVFYKKYELTHGSEDSPDENTLQFQQSIIGLGARLTHNPFFISRFGLQHVDTETSTSDGQDFNLGINEKKIGFYAGTGLQIPLAAGLRFQTIGQIETSSQDLTVLTLLLGLRYPLTEL